jgi:hypothetical protein
VVQHELTAGPAAGFAEPYIFFQMPIEGWLSTCLTVLRLRLLVECLLSECFIVARPLTRVRKRRVRYVDLSHSGLGFRLRFRSAGEEVGMKAFHQRSVRMLDGVCAGLLRYSESLVVRSHGLCVAERSLEDHLFVN